MARVEEHIRELLKLPVEERAEAAQRLLESLDPDDADPDAELLKAAEVTRRARSVAGGAAELVDADEVRRRVAARLREVRGG
jgi:hypothetical protein